MKHQSVLVIPNPYYAKPEKAETLRLTPRAGRPAVSGLLAIGLIAAGIIIGITGYYVATTYQTKIVTVTTTLSTTTSLTETLTQTLTLTQTQILPETLTQTVTSTALQLSTTTATVTSTYTSPTTIYPTPSNVTVDMTGTYLYSYSVMAGSVSYTGSSSAQESVPVTPVFQGETISISVNLNSPTFACPGGSYVDVQLFVNGQAVSNGSQVCGDGTGIQISYIL